MKDGAKRILLLDELRGFAIICMVVHHAFFDFGFVLNYRWGYEIFDALCIFSRFSGRFLSLRREFVQDYQEMPLKGE